MDGKSLNGVDQAIMLYDQQLGVFRPAASTLPADDRLFASSQLFTLADAAYRNQDAHVGSSFCYARTPDDRGMILHRFPDGDTDRLSAATHVLIGDKVAAGMALGLASGWPHWWRGGPWGELYPLDRDHLLEQAQEQLRRQQHTARSRTIEEELTRLIVALVDVRSAPLAITGHTHDPALLLIAARDILRDWASPDWSFSTSEPAQHSGVRITFLLPNGQPHSDGYADLASYPQHSPQLITIANLVRAYTNSPDPATWSTLLEKAGINTLDDLLSWAEGFTPTPGTEDLKRTLNDNHNHQITALKTAAQAAQDALQREIAELTRTRDEAVQTNAVLQRQQAENIRRSLVDDHNQQVIALKTAAQKTQQALQDQITELAKTRDDVAQNNTALQRQWIISQNQWAKSRKELETKTDQATECLAEFEQRALRAEEKNKRLAGEKDSLRVDVRMLQDLLAAAPPANVLARQTNPILPESQREAGKVFLHASGQLENTSTPVAQKDDREDTSSQPRSDRIRREDTVALAAAVVSFGLLFLLILLSGLA